MTKRWKEWLEHACESTGDALFTGLHIAADCAEEEGRDDVRECLLWAVVGRINPRWDSGTETWDWWNAKNNMNDVKTNEKLPDDFFPKKPTQIIRRHCTSCNAFSEHETKADAYLWLIERWPVALAAGWCRTCNGKKKIAEDDGRKVRRVPCPDCQKLICCCGSILDGSHDHNSCGPPIDLDKERQHHFMGTRPERHR